MSLIKGSPDDNSDPKQRTNGLSNNLHKIGKNSQKGVESHNGNGLNNNHEEYKMDIKTNGNDKVAEDDPLTGHRRWDVVEGSKESFQPRWAQRFASTNFFMVIFLLAYVLQGIPTIFLTNFLWTPCMLPGCYFTYFVSVITTIEKLFHIKSASIALLLNFSEIGQICTSLFLTYFAGRGHRPRWIACGMFLFSIAAFGSVSPHFMFGSKLYNRGALAKSESLSVGQNSFLLNHSGEKASLENINNSLCLAQDVYNNLTQLDPCKFESLLPTFTHVSQFTFVCSLFWKEQSRSQHGSEVSCACYTGSKSLGHRNWPDGNCDARHSIHWRQREVQTVATLHGDNDWRKSSRSSSRLLSWIDLH